MKKLHVDAREGAQSSRTRRSPSRGGTGALLLVYGLLLASACQNMVRGRDDESSSSAAAVTQSPPNTFGNSGAQLQLSVLTNSCGANQEQTFFEVTNTGTTPVALSDITVKYWADDTSGQAVVPHVWTGGCVTNVNGNPSCLHQVSGVTATSTAFSACGPDSTHQANWEIAISDTDSATLPPGATWSNIQSALNLANYSNFSPGTGDWYSGCLLGNSYAADPHYALYFKGGLVTASGGVYPSCRAAHGSQSVPGSVPAAEATAPLVGPVPGTDIVHFGIELPLQNPTLLATLSQQLYDPTSASYRHFLTPAEFDADFGVTSTEAQPLVDFLAAQGLTVTATHPDNLLWEVSAPVSAVESAFFVNMNLYGRDGGGVFFAPDRTPTLNLALPIAGIVGLNNFNVAQSAMVTDPPNLGLANIGLGPGGHLMGNDFRNIYVPDTSLTGSQQAVALVEFDGFYQLDIDNYAATSNPPLTGVPTPEVVSVMGGVGTISDGDAEVAMDIELTEAMAPGLAHIYVYEAPSVLAVSNPSNNLPLDLKGYDMANAAIFAQIAEPAAGSGIALANQISDSWLLFDGSSVQASLTKFMMDGQSFFIAAGDTGAYVTGNPRPAVIGPLDDDAVNLMTVAGGTQSASGTGTGTSCLVETTWNQSVEYPMGAGSGGISPASLPGFQPASLATPQNHGSNSKRNLPDVAALADGIWVLSGDGSSARSSGGTSAAAPLWAAFTALANQQAATSGTSVGFLNPTLYRIARGPNFGSDFRDITTGNNSEIGDATQFPAVAGYDLATGWGSFRQGLLNDLAAPAAPLPPVTYGQVTFTIVTGGDNLRCTSKATADLLDAGGNVIHTVVLHPKGQPSWDEESTHTVVDTYPPQTRAGVASVRLTITEGSDTCQIFTSDDTWDIDSVQVQIANPGSPVTIVNLSGNPELVFLNGDQPSQTYTNIFACP